MSVIDPVTEDVPATAPSSAADPVTTEIIRNAFIAIADDINATLIRSAYSPIIYEGKDCSVALMDRDGEVLGQSLGLPLFLGNLDYCVKLIAQMHGWDHFAPGDVFIMNDSYMTGTHLNDMTVITPIFWNGERVGFSASRAHWLDVGAKDPGMPVDSHEIFQEGVRWGPTRVVEGGKTRDEIVDLLRRNNRFGDAAIGDLNAQIAAGRTGEARLQALFDRFGNEAITAAIANIFEQTERLERRAIADIPDGSYEASGFLDNDSLGTDPIPAKLRVDVSGDSIHVDLAGSSPMTTGPVNCGYTQTVAALRVAFKLLIHSDKPVNGGSFKTLTVDAPKGSVYAAEEPAACAWYFTPLGLLIDMFMKALAPAVPDRVAAAHYGDSMAVTIAGTDPRADNARYLMVEPTTGGWGAYAGGDGQDALINNVNGSFRDLPAEVFEHKFPVMIKSYGISQDSGGVGQYRGGNGVYREYQFEAPANLSLWFERSKTPPWGLFGGGGGQGPKIEITMPDGSVCTDLKVNALPVPEGAVLRTQTSGGGGYGDPEKRDPQAIRDDILDRYISPEFAEKHFAPSAAATDQPPMPQAPPSGAEPQGKPENKQGGPSFLARLFGRTGQSG